MLVPSGSLASTVKTYSSFSCTSIDVGILEKFGFSALASIEIKGSISKKYFFICRTVNLLTI